MSLSVTPKFDAFVKFCSEQPPVREIDHDQAWEACAVGDYTLEKFNSRGAASEFLYGDVDIGMFDEVMNVSRPLYQILYDGLNWGGKRSDMDISTYGKMTEWLHQLQHLIHEEAQ